LRTDAVVRFSKGVDPEQTLEMLKYASNLILETTEGDIGSEILEIDVDKETDQPKEKSLDFDFQLARKKIGLDIEVEQGITYLNRLEIEIENEETIDRSIKTIGAPIIFNLKIPTWRNDLKLPEDIVEEIARIHGYDLIEPKSPTKMISATSLPKQIRLQRSVREILTSLDFDEVISYSFISEELKERFEIKDRHLIEVKNAISPELKYVRNTLVPSLLDTFRKNHKRFPEQDLFEIGRRTNTYERDEKNIPEQPWNLGIMQVAKLDKNASGRDEFLEAKGRIEKLVDELTSSKSSRIEWEELSQNDFAMYNIETLHPGRKAKIVMENQIIGWFAQIHPRIVNRISTEEFKLFAAEISLERLESFDFILSDKEFDPISDYPKVSRDISIQITEINKKNDFFKYISNINSELANIEEIVGQPVELKIDYKDEYITDSEVTVTYTVEIVPYKDTLTRETVNELIEEINKSITDKFKATIK
jgi:phenylalanyl-tRNA synthetase beta chain